MLTGWQTNRTESGRNVGVACMLTLLPLTLLLASLPACSDGSSGTTTSSGVPTESQLPNAAGVVSDSNDVAASSSTQAAEAVMADGAGVVVGGGGASSPAQTGGDGATAGALSTDSEGNVVAADGAMTPETDGTGVESSWCDVAPIFEAKCQACHGAVPAAGAPMSLVTPADFQGMGVVTADKDILTLVGLRIRASERPMPPDGSLSEEEKAAIEQWINNGAPTGEGLDCEAKGDGDSSASEAVWPPPDTTACYKVLSHGSGGPDTPMIVKAGAETHPQVIHDAPWGDEAMEAVGIRSITDNAKILHHWIMYDHTGGSGPDAPFIHGWAPGKTDDVLPLDVGMRLPSGPQALRLDMHYYNKAGDRDELDNSGLEVCVAPAGTRENTATTFAGFSNILGLTLPPNQATDIVSYCTIQGSEPVHALVGGPHMHQLGRHMKLEVKRADGGEIESWHDLPFQFEEQRSYSMIGKTLYPGDVVKTTCSYQNDTSRTVTFGDGSDDEMCFHFLIYYPQDSFSCIESPLDALLGYANQDW